jgi:hypothetical protein
MLPGVQVKGGQVLGSSDASPQSSWPSHCHQKGMHFRVELHLKAIKYNNKRGSNSTKMNGIYQMVFLALLYRVECLN